MNRKSKVLFLQKNLKRFNLLGERNAKEIVNCGKEITRILKQKVEKELCREGAEGIGKAFLNDRELVFSPFKFGSHIHSLN